MSSKPFGLHQVPKTPKADAPKLPDVSSLEAEPAWQELRKFIEKSVEDLKEILATSQMTAEQMSAIQGHIGGLRMVLAKVAEWEAPRDAG